jgi:phosphatidylserine/phosphatidylglycerophosphate/cardiolipin synthase-like enzyme
MVMVIDGETGVTGSFNFTKAAEEKNAENLLLIRDKAIAAKYISNWATHADHSEKYEGRQASRTRMPGTRIPGTRSGDVPGGIFRGHEPIMRV